MSYFKNGKRVTEQEFNENAKGFDLSRGFGDISKFTSFVSPIDGKKIGNTHDLEAHNRFHNVQQVGNEYEERLKTIKLSRG